MSDLFGSDDDSEVDDDGEDSDLDLDSEAEDSDLDSDPSSDDDNVLTDLRLEVRTSRRLRQVRNRDASLTAPLKRQMTDRFVPATVTDVADFAKKDNASPNTDKTGLMQCQITYQVPEAFVMVPVGPLRNQLYPVDIRFAMRECMYNMDKWLQAFFFDDPEDDVMSGDFTIEVLYDTTDHLCNSKTYDEFKLGASRLNVPDGSSELFPQLTLHRPYSDITYCNTEAGLHALARFILRKAFKVDMDQNAPLTDSQARCHVNRLQMELMWAAVSSKDNSVWAEAADMCTIDELVHVLPTCSALNDMLANVHSGNVMTASCCARIVNSMSHVLSPERQQECLDFAKAVRDWRAKRLVQITPCMLCTGAVVPGAYLHHDDVYDFPAFFRKDCDPLLCVKCHSERSDFINKYLYPFQLRNSLVEDSDSTTDPSALDWQLVHQTAVQGGAAHQSGFDYELVHQGLMAALKPFESTINKLIACSAIGFRILFHDQNSTMKDWRAVRDALYEEDNPIAAHLPKLSQLHLLPTSTQASWKPGFTSKEIATCILNTALVDQLIDRMPRTQVYKRVFGDNLPKIEIEVALLKTVIRPQDLHRLIDAHLRKLPVAPFLLAGGLLPDEQPRSTQPQSTRAKAYFDRRRVASGLAFPAISTPRHFFRC